MAICGIYVHLADAHELIQTNWCIWSEEGQRQKRQQGHGRSCHLLRKGANINAIRKSSREVLYVPGAEGPTASAMQPVTAFGRRKRATILTIYLLDWQ